MDRISVFGEGGSGTVKSRSASAEAVADDLRSSSMTVFRFAGDIGGEEADGRGMLRYSW